MFGFFNFLIFVSIVGCTSSRDPKVSLRSPVVQAPGLSKNMMSDLGRDQWVDIKKTNKKKLGLYATLGAREWDVAISEARRLLGDQPRDKDGLLVLATALAMSGKHQLSTYYGDLLVKYHGKSSAVYNFRGLAILARPMLKPRDYQSAIKNFRRAFNFSEKEVASGLNYGFLSLSMGKSKEALGIFSQIEDRCNRCIPALMGKGISLTRLARFKKAKGVFKKILKTQPSNLRAHYRLALVEKSGYNNTDRAQYHLKEILADTTDSQLDLKRRANVLLRRLQARDRAHPVSYQD
tara:strand:- start:110 stop:988 length:879 start_codon:yes stop_codon:yes gene_type:complete